MIFKTRYAYGLRRQEAVGLDVCDLGPNPQQPAFGCYGTLRVRFGKGSRGSAPKPGLPTELTPHALRHSYVTHLIEDGFDELFVRLQVGHLHASTTALYTAVSGDYETDALQRALEGQLADELAWSPAR